MKIQALIQHHPSRAELLPPLLEALAPLPVEIGEHASVPPNPWLGYQQCLQRLMESNADFGVLLQDDAQVCTNFPPAVKRIAAANPDTPVVLFLARLPIRVSTLALRATKRREHYLRTQLRINEFMPAVSVLWPRHKAAEFLQWAEENPKKLGHPSPRSDDGVTGRWAALTRQTITFTVPSLVQHPDRVESIIGKTAAWGKDKGRVAQWFCEGDPLEIDWS